MNKIKLASGVLLVFLVGVLAGSLGTGIYYKKHVEKFEAGGPSVQQRIQIITGRFSDELNLTKEQRAEFEKIVKEAQEKIVTLGDKIFPEIKEINEKTFNSIRDKLTAEQKTKLDALIQRMNDIRNKFPSGQRRQENDQPRPQQQAIPEQGPPKANPEQTPPGAMPEPGFGQGTPESMPPMGTGIVRSQKNYGRIARSLNEILNLSKEQESKVRSLLDTLSKDHQKVFEKYKEEKKDSAVLKNSLQETVKSFEKELANILTKEQMEKYRKAKENGDVKLSPSDEP
jgi:molybdopterin-biosynthesis enzyme MoeA-like protein